jgi:NitT/TauT family transport system permease protein
MKFRLSPIVGVLTFFGLWESALRIFHVQRFVLPPPSSILNRLFDDYRFFLRQGLVTGNEALAGLFLALGVAGLLALAMTHWRFINHAVQPVATLIQVIPVICYAPALVIWFRPGYRPIMVMSALVAFVPLLFTLTSGFRNIDAGAHELLRSLGASRWETFRHLFLPGALPSLFSGLRTSIGLCLIGAVLGEWFALRSSGLGVQIQVGMNHNEAMLIWASAFALGALGAFGLGCVALAERLFRRP